MYYYSVKTPPWIGGVCESFMRWGNGCRVRGSGFRVSPWGGAAHKNIEAPRSIDGGDARKWYLAEKGSKDPAGEA